MHAALEAAGCPKDRAAGLSRSSFLPSLSTLTEGKPFSSVRAFPPAGRPRPRSAAWHRSRPREFRRRPAFPPGRIARPPHPRPRRRDGLDDLRRTSRPRRTTGAARFANHPVALKNCTEVLVLTQPKMIEDIHRAYLEAGADIIETDTFNGNRLSLEEFGLEDHVVELNRDGRRDRPPRRRRVHPRGPRTSPGSSPAASGRPRSSSRWASTSTTPAAAT